MSVQALTRLEQASVQLAGGECSDPRSTRLSTVLGLVEEAVQPALHEGYAVIEVTGGRGHPHNAVSQLHAAGMLLIKLVML